MLKLKVCVVVCAVMLFASSASAVVGGAFHQSPESFCDDWQTAFPYQRNILIDFSTDPDTWPKDPTDPSGQRVDFQPGVNYELFGTHDLDWYESDWGEGDDVDWFDQFPVTGVPSTRQGFVGIVDQESRTGWITLHLDNDPTPRPLKHIYIELEYYTSGSGDLGMPGYNLPDGVYLVGNPKAVIEPLDDGWKLLRVCATFEPNPPWEEMTLYFLVEEFSPGTVLIDYIHVATECVPEPGTMALLGLGAVALIRRRRKD